MSEDGSVVSINYPRVFISYSHKDATHLERLKVHLASKMRKGLDVWDDTRIQVGQQWREEIQHALARANVAILLVSADFLASEFIAENELPPLLSAAKTGGTRILPVIVGACAYSASPLAQFQALNAPSNPLNRLSRAKREGEWVKIATEAERVVADALAVDESTSAEDESKDVEVDAFWTEEHIHELEQDLKELDDRGDSTDDAAWMWEQLQQVENSDKARMLTIWDSLSEWELVSWEGKEKQHQQSRRFLGYLRDWRVWHSG